MSSGQGGSDTLLDPESGSVSRLAERSTPSIVEAAHRVVGSFVAGQCLEGQVDEDP